MNREEAETQAATAARRLVGDLRQRNAAWSRATGEPSSVSDADYAKAESEVIAALLRIWQAIHGRGQA